MIFIQDPAEIEARSMALIAPYLEELKLDEAHTKIFSRVIHAAGDTAFGDRTLEQIRSGPFA